MGVNILGRAITKVGVIGSGQIGPDIALHFTRTLAQYGVPVVVVDVSEDALGAGRAKMQKKVGKGVESGAFSSERAESMLGNVTFTSDYSALRGADLIVEAATEDLRIKHKIFAQLEESLPPETILASNSSHMEPEVIFSEVKHKARSMVIHYFFPAERNIVVEVVPGSDTHADVVAFVMKLYEFMGKLPIRVVSRYGFAIDPIFEGLFQAAGLLYDAGVATPPQIDAVAQKVLGLGVGPFTAMNLTGGNPITHHGLNQYTEKLMSWFRSPECLDKAMKTGEKWPMAARGEKVEVPDHVAEAVGKALKGAYFGLVTHILDAGIIDVGHLEMGVSTALVVRRPFAYMNKIGVAQALALVQEYASQHEGFVVPKVLEKQVAAGKSWDVATVWREDRGGVAVLTLCRPAVLNALNDSVMAEIDRHIDNIRNDPNIKAAVMTGFGTKAFVSGADINELAALPDAEAAVAKCLRGAKVLRKIEKLGKPVVACYNGLAFGGGNELGMACTARVAVEGHKALVSQPEPRLGIIPGYGGTQRLPRWVGVAAAWPILRTARPISTQKAAEVGLVQKTATFENLLDTAVDYALALAEGRESVGPIPTGPITVPDNLPEVDIGHLSRRTDEILKKAILEGARTSLDEGIALEARCFGECLGTEDMKIGMENFMKNGPKVDAKFTHR